MTTDALGPCPPQRPAKHMFVGYEEWACVSTDYADYWRRRAERAEALLREAMVSRIHTMTCATHQFKPCNCDLWSGRVVAHFAEVKP